jgi:hypothetical protein
MSKTGFVGGNPARHAALEYMINRYSDAGAAKLLPLIQKAHPACAFGLKKY